MNAQNFPFLILASRSPRRAGLLRESGFSFRQIDPPYDDTGHVLAHLDPPSETAELARRKARSVAASLQEGLILGVDTLVFCDGHRLGKPSDAIDARSMLTRLMGRRHLVFSGLCLIDARSQIEQTAWRSAEVLIHPVAPAVLEDYLLRGAWAGKAGGYNLAEMTSPWQIEVTGEADCVMGLPVSALRELLQKSGLESPGHP